jgi:hypothetical protein
MFERFSRSWSLVKASWSVLRQDKELLLFPLLSSIAMLVVVACFALPVIGIAGFDGLARLADGKATMGQYALAFLFYVVQYFVMFYFNAALVGAAMIRLGGGNPRLSDGLAIASSRLGSILGYAMIAATVGMVLRAIQERVGFVGKIIVGMLGVGWTVATFLVVPVLVTRDVGPVEAVKESALLLKRTWGENIVGQGGIGVAFGLIQVAIVIGGVVLVFAVAAMTHSVGLIIATIAALIIVLLASALVQAALSGIYSAALYRFAADEGETRGFDSDTLRLAFKPK